jgi:hypothetical protein
MHCDDLRRFVDACRLRLLNNSSTMLMPMPIVSLAGYLRLSVSRGGAVSLLAESCSIDVTVRRQRKRRRCIQETCFCDGRFPSWRAGGARCVGDQSRSRQASSGRRGAATPTRASRQARRRSQEENHSPIRALRCATCTYALPTSSSASILLSLTECEICPSSTRHFYLTVRHALQPLSRLIVRDSL